MTSVFSCSDDFIDPQLQQNKIIDDTPITTVEQLQIFMNGTYATMRRNEYYYGRDYIVFGEVRGTDEMFTTGSSGRFLSPASFTVGPTDAYASNTWRAIYRVISNANIVINANITSSAATTDPTAIAEAVTNIKAQAYAIRALAYFDLIKLYGQKYSGRKGGQVPLLGVPLVLEVPKTEEVMNFKPARATLDECYTQIESDFNTALSTISDTGVGSITLTKEGIAGLMSRYYLYKEDYAKVYQYANMVTPGRTPIDAGLYPISWKIESLNSIFELAYGVASQLGTTGLPYIYWRTGYGNTRLLPSFVATYQAGDVRAVTKQSGAQYGMINKASATAMFLEGKNPDKSGSCNQKMVRYEEVALNQVESILMGGGGSTSEALTLINKIRAQRGVAALSSVTMTDLKNERAWELVGEGFRSWDLLRWNQALTIRKIDGTTGETIPFGDYRLTFPIPQAEIDANPNVEQNRLKGDL